MRERPIIQAIKNDALDDLDDLLISAEAKETKIDETDKHDKTALLHAAKQGYTPVVNALLALGANINAVDANGMNALMLAVTNNHRDVVDLLLEVGGIDIDATDNWSDTAVDHAIKIGNLEILDKLLTYGARTQFDKPAITNADEEAPMPCMAPLLIRATAPRRARATPVCSDALVQLMKDKANRAEELRSFFCEPSQSSHGFFSQPKGFKSSCVIIDEDEKAIPLPRFFLLPSQPMNCLVLIPKPETVQQLQQVQILLPEVVKIIEEYLSFNSSSKCTKRLK